MTPSPLVLPAGLPQAADALDTVAEETAVTPVPFFKERFGRYEVLRRPDHSLWELGRGAMGVTYKAWDTRLRRTVALKVINSALLGGDTTARQRFLREASSAAQLHHPHIATVFDISEEGGDDFYVMEFIEGEDLLSHLRRGGPVPVAFGLTVARQVAQALGAAWQQRVVHRDIKPANLMLARSTAAGQSTAAGLAAVVKVVDFGLAKALGASAEGSALVSRGTGFIGTAAYASPEQIEGGEVDIRSDLYSLGVTLWHLLAGQPTFGNTSLQQAISGHLAKPPPFGDLRGVGAPEPVIRLLSGLLEKDPDQRLATPEALEAEIQDIARWLEDEPGATRPAFARPAAARPGAQPALPTVAPAAPAAGEAEVTLQMASAAAGASFPLVEVLRQRGALRIGDVLALVDGLVPVVDACAKADAALLGELSPATVHVQFTAAPANLAALPVMPVETWPPFGVHVRSPHGSHGVSSGAAMSVGRTLLPARDGGGAVPRFAALVYELLNGTPPGPDGTLSPLPALNEEGNDVLRRALSPDGFPSAGAFLHALRGALGGGTTLLPRPAPAAAFPSLALPVLTTKKPAPEPAWTPAPVMAVERRSGGGLWTAAGKTLLVFAFLSGVGAVVKNWSAVRERVSPWTARFLPATAVTPTVAVPAAMPAVAAAAAVIPARTLAPTPAPVFVPTPRPVLVAAPTPRPTPVPTPTPVVITVVMPTPPPHPHGGPPHRPGGGPGPNGSGQPHGGFYPPPPHGYPPPPPPRRR